MSKKQSLTVAELKALLLANFIAKQREQGKLIVRLEQELGNTTAEENSLSLTIKEKWLDWISDTLARRLKRNRRTTPLLSPRDFNRFTSLVIDEIEKDEGEKFEVEERKMVTKFIKAMQKSIFEMVHAMVPTRKCPYEVYWQWVTIVLDLSTERRVRPTNLLTIEEANDEITRRIYSKKQFVSLSKKASRKFMDADVLKKIIIQPMLDMFPGDDKEERREFMRELEEEIMPQLREVVEKTKVVVNTWLDEEVGRIYKAA